MWCFDLQTTMLSHTGTCSTFSWPANADLVGPAGGAEFGVPSLALGVFVKVRWTLALGWHVFIQQSGALDWFIVDQALTWNAGLGGWDATFTRTRVSPPGCTQHLYVLWRPQMISGLTVRRGPIDQITNGGATVLSWYHEDADLPGHTKKFAMGGQQLWEPGHLRGTTRKYLSTGLPPDFGPTSAFAP